MNGRILKNGILTVVLCSMAALIPAYESEAQTSCYGQCTTYNCALCQAWAYENWNSIRGQCGSDPVCIANADAWVEAEWCNCLAQHG